ncbi:MAG: esterase/lipase family protein, partial [Bacteroidota bacterium]
MLTEAAISLATGASKVVLRELMDQSGNEDEKGSIIPYRSVGNKSILCLVHGFSGDAEKTFKPMPELITEDEDLSGWDIISIGYSTDLLPDIGKGIWAADPDITKIAGFLQTNLEILFNHYDRVALLGHSMGGLVIQRALLNLEDSHRITHVLFYGTPSGGLKKASGFKWFKKQIRDMSEDGPFISTLRNDWSSRFVEDYPFKFATVAGESDEF